MAFRFRGRSQKYHPKAAHLTQSNKVTSTISQCAAGNATCQTNKTCWCSVGHDKWNNDDNTHPLWFALWKTPCGSFPKSGFGDSLSHQLENGCLQIPRQPSRVLRTPSCFDCADVGPRGQKKSPSFKKLQTDFGKKIKKSFKEQLGAPVAFLSAGHFETRLPTSDPEGQGTGLVVMDGIEALGLTPQKTRLSSKAALLLASPVKRTRSTLTRLTTLHAAPVPLDF